MKRDDTFTNVPHIPVRNPTREQHDKYWIVDPPASD